MAVDLPAAPQHSATNRDLLGLAPVTATGACSEQRRSPHRVEVNHGDNVASRDRVGRD
jgi:hypothetical protein